MQLWSFSRFYKRDVLLEEFTSDESGSLHGACGEILLENSRALTVLSVFDVQIAFNHRILIEIVDRWGLTRVHEAMVSDDSLSNASVSLGLLLVEHDEQQIET